MKLFAIAIAAALPLSACAGQVEMRRVAGQSATILTTYRNSVRDFAAGQTALNIANEQRLDQLRNETADREAEIANRRDGWDLAGDKEALRRFAVVSKVKGDDVLADMAPRLPTTPPAALSYDSSNTDAVLKRVISLGKPITVEQQLQDLVAFGTKLRERYRDNLQKATGDAAKANGDSGAAASAITLEATPQENDAVEGGKRR